MPTATHFSWTGTPAPWWVTPLVTLAAVWITRRSTLRQDRRNERRRSAIDHREQIREAFEIKQLTAPYHSFLPNEKEVELALLDLGFRRFQVYDMMRQLYDHRNDEDSLKDVPRGSLKEITIRAQRRADWSAIQEALNRYLNGEVSLYRARRKLYGWHSLRRRRKAKRWAKDQYQALQHRDGKGSVPAKCQNGAETTGTERSPGDEQTGPEQESSS